MKKFAKKCSHCEKLINEGIDYGEGEEIFCSPECLFQWLYKEDIAYWTSWEDESEYQYYEDGTEVVKMIINEKERKKILEKFEYYGIVLVSRDDSKFDNIQYIDEDYFFEKLEEAFNEVE
jgi:hypothetical protein